MSMSLNRAQLIGNITRDPESKALPGGQIVVTFGLATNFSWIDANGEKKEKTEFHNIVAWKKLAEIISQFVKKGNKVFVEGRIQTREWDGQDGVKRYRTEIVADNLIMLDRKDKEMVSSAVISNMFASASPVGKQWKLDNFAIKHTALPLNSSNSEVTRHSVTDEEISIEDLPY
jgi:single-strand DNA-binding protein